MVIVLILTIMINLTIGISLYYFLKRRMIIFTDRFGFTSSYVSSSTSGLAISLGLVLLFQNHIEMIGVLNILIGIGFGWLYGSLLNSQSIIAGIYHGGISGMMGTMLGAIVLDPSICGLPESLLSGQNIIVVFALLSVCIQGLSALLLLFSFRA
ncbi:hypothetical protein [Mesobacillus subterraneus]|uniref:Uncharacterized protein n=1 Tax=Mesobacillus subterraneus TaxID=285983 RepID=A0A3R9KT02_9BACI|nr:hypothetical protein [Mesobacillus subterraneus]RSD25407.1 hypothetical protein EJA10_16490 [Mesobacillus subterraneus]